MKGSSSLMRRWHELLPHAHLQARQVEKLEECATAEEMVAHGERAERAAGMQPSHTRVGDLVTASEIKTTETKHGEMLEEMVIHIVAEVL